MLLFWFRFVAVAVATVDVDVTVDLSKISDSTGWSIVEDGTAGLWTARFGGAWSSGHTETVRAIMRGAKIISANSGSASISAIFFSYTTSPASSSSVVIRVVYIVHE
jgi:hypothetical protein